ncbi:MAG: MarR family transcriptional regulator [Bacteroidia bacterium]|nr:MAG: MarR family transcriptional regulator [Bacteroidia bacterium]
MPTSTFDPSNQDNIDRKIAFGFERIAQVLKTLIWSESKESGLSPIQIQFLIALAFNSHRDWTVSDLAAYFQLTPATVSDALTALEEKDLLVRRQSKEDKRVSNIVLTAAGRRQALKLAGWMNAIQDEVARLDADSKATMLHALMNMIASLQQKGLISVVQMCMTCTYFRPNAHPGKSKPHHCAYIDMAFGDADLRLDCPDYARKEAEG